MLKGQCLCSAVQYRYEGELAQTIVCFCQDCQRAQGGVFAWNSPVEREKFKIMQGAELLKEYFHTPNKARVFCQTCASPIYSYRLDLNGVIRLRLGSVTEGFLPIPEQVFYTMNQPDFVSLETPHCVQYVRGDES